MTEFETKLLAILEEINKSIQKCCDCPPCPPVIIEVADSITATVFPNVPTVDD